MADIVVIGGANIDIKAKTSQPNRLGTSNPGVVSMSPGGVGRNIAHNLARLGAKVAFISAVGRDDHGDTLLKVTSEAGVDISRVLRADTATGSYVVFLDHDGELVTALSDMRSVNEVTPEVVVHNADTIAAARFVVADCNLPLETVKAIAALAGDRLLIEPVSVSKSEKLIAVLKDHPVFLSSPNFDQIDHLTGSRDIRNAFAFLHGAGLRNVVIHAGAEGAFVSDGKSIDHVEPRSAGPTVDVTGAGDAAVAGLVFGLLNNEPLPLAAAWAQELAGRVIASTASTLE